MKKLILLLGVLLNIFTYSQSEEKNAIEEKAYFPKGNQVFRTMISKNIRTDKILSNGNQNIHCELTFIIDREGSITDVKAFGDNKEFNDEAVNALSQIKEKWIPGKINGVAVRSRYKVPLDMKFENDTQPTYFRTNEGFIQEVKEKISLKKIKEKENMFCEISFVVETNGKISNINVTGDNESLNKEVIRVVSKIKGRWIPAIINGAVVSQVFKLPLEINAR